MAGQEMLKQPCSTSTGTIQPKRMLAIQAGLPNHAAYAGQPQKHSAAHQNCENRRSKQKPNRQASSSASCRVIPGLSYIPLTHWPTLIPRQHQLPEI
ncbi:hypothetical protein PCASD_23032 [Puccinia coronata f. sp. avenae]|uniref:Uncharacterized protein n=1 Tax=Puccinia coronata f. sp. avenae TaxID=200324 RepID=A0A2N5TNH1_9BASI|nr:hypothetical protein PCASD_23032 [Puccinia coronata f. sp. avenae]